MAAPIDAATEEKEPVVSKKVENMEKRKKSNVEGIEVKEGTRHSPQTGSKKRKREVRHEEIEIDVNLPEPASRKALRKAKKAKENPSTSATTIDTPLTETKSKPEDANDEKKLTLRSEFGVWVGNLPWSATKEALRTFLTDNADITHDQITRVHMPAPSKPPNPRWTTKPLNKGFAYVDFSTQLAMYATMALTETLMDGRPLLIKNAKNFEGRPEKADTESKIGITGKGGHPPNKRVFVGNLAFDITKNDMLEHFGQCGDVADIHVATFEDTGKCKGYAWITFEDIEAAKSAVRGYIFKAEAKKNEGGESDQNEESSEENEKKQKNRKWFVNKLRGRDLRCEFAEDSTTRYNKRYGKEKKEDMEGVHPERVKHLNGEERNHRPRPKNQQHRKVDPRTIKPGAAQMNTQRASQAIVESKGKKITFE
ncbi:hypothetical protein K469DRAFT_698538 [Zopfia rhizophila CBS 207.26]|uniref:RRM domain-containing protein n=1 Tax=Zopfia rhizophila CBS 207.26 TaxID=1314779 RepID=A0A6A6EVD4_9PEZI|nr:hypothetical protein K469DRAFT_698538 [Zopfia rhizophila CBS 207.26]